MQIFSNQSSKVCSNDADFYSFAWKMFLNSSILQLWCANQSRYDQVWAWFRKLTLRSTKWYMDHADCMHLSGDIACQSWSIIAKFWPFKPLYWLNQMTKTLVVLARILKFIFSAKPIPTVGGFGEKSWLKFNVTMSSNAYLHWTPSHRCLESILFYLHKIHVYNLTQTYL